MNKKILNITLAIIFILASLFDLLITHHFYLQDKIGFLDMEFNKIMTWGLKNNIPFFLNPSVILNFSIVGLFLFLTLKKDKKIEPPHKFFFYTFLTLGTIGHIYGGLSWL